MSASARRRVRAATIVLGVTALVGPTAAHAAPDAGRIASVQAVQPSSIATISDDGRIAVLIREEGYPHNHPPYNQGYVRDLWCDTTTTIPRRSTAAVTPKVWADGFDEKVAATPDGRFIAFSAWLTWPGYAVAVHDRRTGTVIEASAGVAGARLGNPSLSTDGRYVAFDTEEGGVYVRDLRRGTLVRVDRTPDGRIGAGWSGSPRLSATGRFVAFASGAADLVPGDTNGVPDVFVHDSWTGRTSRVSTGPGGAQADGGSGAPRTSADGRYVAFLSGAADLVPGDTNGEDDVFVHDRWHGTTRRVSTGTHGQQANARSWAPSLSADGRTVAYTSQASNLVADDTNGENDVFVTDLSRGTVRRASLGRGGAQLNQGASGHTLSANGRYLGFSTPEKAVPGDTNGLRDGYVRDLWTDTITRATLFAPTSAGP